MNLIKKSAKWYKIWNVFYTKKTADISVIEYNLIMKELWIN